MQTYTVQAGDTLYGIAKQFGVTVEEIKLENNLVSNNISVGQVLKIPTVSTTSLYIVKKGDTLYSIASKYETTVSELMQLNNLKTPLLSVGQQLKIPIQGDITNEDYFIYTVKAGDNLYSIAKRYDVTVESIQTLNNLNSTLLSIGQQLKIPVTSSDVTEKYQTHIVRSRDTLYSIANNYGMTVDELMKLNNLNNTNLSIGQVLKVKIISSSDIVLGSQCYGEGYKEPTYVTYIVKKGDSLYVIAKKYNITVDQLIELNDLKSNNLSIGQVLKIREV